MAIYIGSKKVKDVYYGNRKVAKIYKGSNLIYKSASKTITYYCFYDPEPIMSVEGQLAHYLYCENEQPSAGDSLYAGNGVDTIYFNTSFRVKAYDAVTQTITTGFGTTATRDAQYDINLPVT